MNGKFVKYIPAMAAGLFIFSVIYYFSCIQADGYYYLDGGRRMIEIGGIPDRDVFSFNTAFTYWRVIEWLSNLIFYGLYNLGGEKLLLVIIPLVFSFIFFFFWEIRSQKPTPLSLFIYSMVVVGFYYDLFVIRAELLMTLYYFIFFYFFIMNDYSRYRLLPGAFFLQILWVNSHPSFILPIVFSFILCFTKAAKYIFSGQPDQLASLRKYSILCGVLFTASLLNPYGWESFQDFFYRIFSYAYGAVDITQGLSLASPKECFIWLFIGIITFVTLKRKDLSAELKLVLFSQIIMTVYGVRYLILLLITSIPVIVPMIDDIVKLAGKRFESTKKPSLALKIIFTLAALFISIYLFTLPRYWSGLYSHIDPAVEYLRSQRGETSKNLLNPYEYGTYLIHRLYPDYKVFVDGRSYLYDSNLVYIDYRKIAYGSDSERDRLLSCYPLDLIIWPKSMKKLYGYLKLNPAWEEAFESQVFSVFNRSHQGP